MTSSVSTDFIRTIINEHQEKNTYGGKVVTRFPPEPNGHLHIGHAKSICLNFGLAEEYKGLCHLRFDDTDPAKEEASFERAIEEAIQWLGFSWGESLYHTSDYFETLYDLAEQLIKQGSAYVCSQSLEEIREYRGTVTEAGKNSPYRTRSIDENLDLFRRMKAGEFKDGEHVLRAKIDMAAANMKMRDPLLYRIRHESHHVTGDTWCIYPMYDFAHCLSDSIEGITHSICTLEFENNRELYDWIIDTLDMPAKPKQYEFARLNINYAVMSKRKIQELVETKKVTGWNDPRLLTLLGLRRRGYTPESIRQFCSSVGIAKANSVVDMAQLEFSIRNDLNQKAPRVLAVLKPLKLVITNYPEDKTLEIDAPYYPDDVPKEGSRKLPFSREIYIEEDDFIENPPKGFFRLSPGGEVRLRHAYIIRCNDVLKDESGKIVELHCTYDEATPLGENPSDGRRVKGTIQWVSAKHAVPIDVRIYDRLFLVENPGSDKDSHFLDEINPNSLKTYPNALVEESVRGAQPETHFQFERHGYFVTDMVESNPENLVFNRTVALKDSWQKKQAPKQEAPKKQPQAPKKQKTTKAPEIELSAVEKALSEGYQNELNLPKDDANLLAQNPMLSDYFEEALKLYQNPKALANWILNDMSRVIKEQEEKVPPCSAEHLVALIKNIDDETISTKIAKEVFALMLATKRSPNEIIEEKGLKQITDPAVIESIIDDLLTKHQDVVEQIQAGRTNRMSFFVGQVMKQSAGKASPKLVNEILQKKFL
jgi:glutaminyl-tRNA synthetase